MQRGPSPTGQIFSVHFAGQASRHLRSAVLLQEDDLLFEPFNAYAWDWKQKVSVLMTYGYSFTGSERDAEWRREVVRGRLFVPLAAAMCGINHPMLSLQLVAQPLVTIRSGGAAFGVECLEIRLAEHGTPVCSARDVGLCCFLQQALLQHLWASQTSAHCSLQLDAAMGSAPGMYASATFQRAQDEADCCQESITLHWHVLPPAQDEAVRTLTQRDREWLSQH